MVFGDGVLAPCCACVHQRLVQQLASHLEAEYKAAEDYDIQVNPPDHLQGKWCVEKMGGGSRTSTPSDLATGRRVLGGWPALSTLEVDRGFSVLAGRAWSTPALRTWSARMPPAYRSM
jgi:hypothetical protein